ncbi:hypothetical protein [Novosphingobium sp.]|uniref:putative barnase/colicin E5 family endoribonuclease n=1 Tax=Novosphingobium sp. TaxID=1874826 RepID=UPI00286DBCB2|nr:hypothetical protein [Novosphingobium sp.]
MTAPILPQSRSPVRPRPSMGPPARPGEVYDAASAMQEAENSDGLDRAYDEEFAPVIRALNEIRHQRGQIGIVQPSSGVPVENTLTIEDIRRTGGGSGYGFASRRAIGRDDVARQILAEVAREQARDPRALKGIATNLDAFMAPRYERDKVKRAEASEVLARSPGGFKAGVAGFAGGTVQSLNDMDNVPWLLVGGWGKTVAKRVLTEGLANMAPELIHSPKVDEYLGKLGETRTFGDKARNAGYAFAGGAVLRGGFESLPYVGKGAGKALDLSRSGFERVVTANWDRLPEGLRTRWAARATLVEPGGQERLLADIAQEVIGKQHISETEAAALTVLRREADVAASNPYEANGAGQREHGWQINSRLRGVPAAAKATGTFDMGRFMGRNRAAESGGNDVAAATTSSAYGRYQFLKSTWLGSYKQTFGSTGESDAAILAKRADGAVQDKVMQTFTAGNVRALRAAQVPVDDGTVYLAHFLGSRDAVRVLRAAGDTPVHELVSAASIRANRTVFARAGSASELVSWARGKMQQDGGGSVPARAGAGGDDAIDAELASLAEERALLAEKRAMLAAEEGRAGDGPDMDFEPAPQLRRDLFGSDIEWRIAQSRAEADELGLTAPLFGKREAWAEARDTLMAAKAGEVRGALSHPEIGAIDVKWGDAKGGLAHIAAKHPEVMDDLPAIIDAMEVTSRSKNRIRMESPDHQAVVRLDYDGEAQQWLLTAFEVKKGKVPPAAEDGGAASGARDRSPSAGTVGDIGASGSIAKVPDDLRAALTPYPPPSMGRGESGFYTFQDGQGRTISWHPGDGVANGAAPKRTGVSADDVREWLGRPRQDVADPRMGDSQLAAFDDPAGAAVTAQVEGLAHDVRAAIEAGDLDGLAFAAIEGREATVAAEVLAKLDADDAALKALRGCL